MSEIAEGNLLRKRLVIFGCGYLGSEVARQALAAGARVVALTRNPATADRLRQTGVEVVVGDLAGEDWHARIEGAADAVVNTVSSGGGGLEAYARSYRDGARSIAAWARKTEPSGAIVYTSSTSVYPQDGGVVVDEAAPTHGSGERGAVLLGAEDILREAAANGLFGRCFVLRLAGLYGSGRHYLLDQVRAGAVSGRGETRLNLVHRDDAAAAIAAALDAPEGLAGETFNVADDAPAPKAEVVAWLARRLGVPVPVFTGAPAGERRALTPDRVIANDKLKGYLGWRPQYPSFREGYENILSRGAE